MENDPTYPYQTDSNLIVEIDQESNQLLMRLWIFIFYWIIRMLAFNIVSNYAFVILNFKYVIDKEIYLCKVMQCHLTLYRGTPRTSFCCITL